jgi:hypothetical protein
VGIGGFVITVSAPKRKIGGLGSSVLATDSRVEGTGVFPWRRLTLVSEAVGSRRGPTTRLINKLTMVTFRLSSMEQGLNNQQEGYNLDRPDDRR